MNKFSKEQFTKAKQFIKSQAQDIDKAMYEYLFENKPLGEVVDVLASYQNEDGGFGKLDYDFEYPYSCLKHTESACRYIYELNVPIDYPLIQKLIPYILKNLNRHTGMWDNLIVERVNDYPHAPWWHYEKPENIILKTRADVIENYDPNTNSALAGILVKYSSLIPSEILNEVTSIVIEKITSSKSFYQYGMMSDLYFVNSLNDTKLKNSLLKILMGNGNLITLLDGNWGAENAFKLCTWIDSPDHPYYPMYKSAVHDNFDFLIKSQNEDGSWSPDWGWGDAEVSKRVEKRLKGLLTYKFLTSLKKFDYIEN